MLWLLVALVALNVADLVLTAIGLKRGYAEASPVPRGLFKHFGFWPMSIALKILMIGAAWFAQVHWVNGWIFTAVLCALGVVVVGWNIRTLSR